MLTKVSQVGECRALTIIINLNSERTLFVKYSVYRARRHY